MVDLDMSEIVLDHLLIDHFFFSCFKNHGSLFTSLLLYLPMLAYICIDFVMEIFFDMYLTDSGFSIEGFSYGRLSVVVGDEQ